LPAAECAGGAGSRIDIPDKPPLKRKKQMKGGRMKAYIECIHDEVLKLSTGRYAKIRVIIPQCEGENYQKYHLGECEILQDGEILK
jgi:hypothetical protein